VEKRAKATVSLSRKRAVAPSIAVLLLIGTLALAAAVPHRRAAASPSLPVNDQIFVVGGDGQGLRILSDGRRYYEHPVWSPDGKRLAFTASSSAGRRQLEILPFPSGGAQPVPVIRRLGNPSEPEWSPRRDEIAFSTYRELRIDTLRSVVIASSDGSRPRRLATHAYGASFPAGPVWSPDGNRLCYVRQRRWRPKPGKPVPPVSPDTEAFDLVIVSRSGGRHVIRIPGADTDPRWSPSGRRIAFVHKAGRERYELWTISPSGRHVRRLGRRLLGPRNPEWSPDGRQIALTAIGADHRPHLFLADTGGRARQVRVSGLVAELRPVWSPDARLLAFADYDGHVNVIAPDGSGQRTVVTLAGADIFELAWSPDGRWIAFVAAKHVQET
jgi:Tol biopolymer transport system component